MYGCLATTLGRLPRQDGKNVLLDDECVVQQWITVCGMSLYDVREPSTQGMLDDVLRRMVSYMFISAICLFQLRVYFSYMFISATCLFQPHVNFSYMFISLCQCLWPFKVSQSRLHAIPISCYNITISNQTDAVTLSIIMYIWICRLLKQSYISLILCLKVSSSSNLHHL